MQVIFLKSKRFAAAIRIGILLLAGLLALTIYAEKKDYQDLVLIIPDGIGLPALDLKEVNRLGTEELSLTYEINQRVTAESAHFTRAVTLTGTNISYADIMDHKLTAGSFWSEEAWTMGSRYVVLNEPAAFRLFGSNSIIGNTVKFEGEVWLVTGVVRDGNKKKEMAYVPASVMTGQPEALLAKSSGGTAAVMNRLSSLDVYEGNCRTVDVGAVAGLFWQLLIAAVCCGTALAAILFGRRQVFVLSADYGRLRIRYQTMYPEELVKKSRRELGQMVFRCLMLIFCIAVVFFTARQILTLILQWQEIGRQFQYITDCYFSVKMQWLVRCFVSGPILFSGFFINVVMAGFRVLFKNPEDYVTIN